MWAVNGNSSRNTSWAEPGGCIKGGNWQFEPSTQVIEIVLRQVRVK